jgi:hypothetical protein
MLLLWAVMHCYATGNEVFLVYGLAACKHRMFFLFVDWFLKKLEAKCQEAKDIPCFQSPVMPYCWNTSQMPQWKKAMERT